MLSAAEDGGTAEPPATRRRMTRRGGRIGGRRAAPTPTPSESNRRTATASLWTVGAFAVLAVLATDALTLRFEAVQSWRYAWPLLGALYVASGATGLMASQRIDEGSDDRDAIKRKETTFLASPDGNDPPSATMPFLGFNGRCTNTLSVVAGTGLMAGGYVDAFFPVWYTSPDVLGTRAGLESDSAAVLLLLTLVGVLTGYVEKRNLSLSHGARETERRRTMVGRKGEDSDGFGIVGGLCLGILCAQLWEMGVATFYSWGEMMNAIAL